MIKEMDNDFEIYQIDDSDDDLKPTDLKDIKLDIAIKKTTFADEQEFPDNRGNKKRLAPAQ